MVAIGEHLGLQRQECATGIHQVDAGQVVLERNLLGTQVLFDGYRVIGATLDRGVVGQDHHLFALHHTDAGHDAGRRFLAVVHFPRCQGAKFQKGSVGVHQPVDAVPCQHLASAAMQVYRPLAASGANLGQPLFQVADQRFHAGLVVQEIPVGGAEVGTNLLPCCLC